MIRTLTVWEAPVPKPRPRFVRRTGHAYTPSRAADAEHRIREAWRQEYGEQFSQVTGPVALVVVVSLARPAIHYGTGRNAGILRLGAPDRPAKKPDLDNYIKTVLDALSGWAWRDDGQVVDLSAHKRYADGEPPRWGIEVRYPES